MINKIKSWPIGAKILGGVVGGLVGLLLLLCIIAFVGGFVQGFKNGFNKDDYFTYHGPKMVQLDSDMNSLTSSLVKLTQGDANQGLVTDIEAQSEAVGMDIYQLQEYDGSVPSKYTSADQVLSQSLNDLQSANDDLTQAIKNDDVSSFESDEVKIIAGRTLLRKAADDIVQAHKQN